MDKVKQIKLEMHHASNNRKQLIASFMHPFAEEIKEAALHTELFLLGFEDYDNRPDLEEIYPALLKIDIADLFTQLIGITAQREYTTLQQVMGQLLGYVSKISTMSRQLKALCFLIPRCPFVHLDIEKGAEFGYVRGDIQFDEEDLAVLNQQSVALPSIIPLKKVRSNSEIGYRTFRKSVVMGGKHHEYNMCLEHINKRNSVALQLDPEIVARVLTGDLGAFDPTPKFNKKTAKMETPTEVQDRKAAWVDLHADLKAKVHALGHAKLYPAHRKDVRGRLYVEAFHFNYQGNDWQKACVSLARKEKIEPEF